jgi:hypothetical protein
MIEDDGNRENDREVRNIEGIRKVRQEACQFAEKRVPRVWPGFANNKRGR